jgi:hypothetical protein
MGPLQKLLITNILCAIKSYHLKQEKGWVQDLKEGKIHRQTEKKCKCKSLSIFYIYSIFFSLLSNNEA